MTRRNRKTGMRVRAAAFFLASLGFAAAIPASTAKPSRRHAVDAASAGTGQITGKIYFKGARPKLARIDMKKDPVCASEHSETVYAQDGAVNNNDTLPNAFVYIKQGSVNLARPNQRSSVDFTQKDCMYEPPVLGIMVRQPLPVLTLDPTTHNI